MRKRKGPNVIDGFLHVNLQYSRTNNAQSSSACYEPRLEASPKSPGNRRKPYDPDPSCGSGCWKLRCCDKRWDIGCFEEVVTNCTRTAARLHVLMSRAEAFNSADVVSLRILTTLDAEGTVPKNAKSILNLRGCFDDNP